MARILLQDALDTIHPEINKILSKDYREALDKKITILDLGYEALKVNVYRNTEAHLLAYEYAYTTLLEVLREKIPKNRQYSLITDIPAGYFNNPRAPYLFIDGPLGTFIVALGFAPIRAAVTSLISKDPRMAKTSFGTSTVYKDVLNKKGVPSGDTEKSLRTKVDIGHTATEGNDNLTLPLELKLLDIINLGKSIGSTKGSIIEEQAKKALSLLYSIQAEALYSFKNTAPEAILAAKSTLGEMYVVVTLHRQKLNAAFSKKELEVYNKLKVKIASLLSTYDIAEITGSNNIYEDIVQKVTNTLLGITTSIAKHTTKKVSKPKTTVKPNIKIKVDSTTKKQVKPQQLRNLKGQFTSLTNLQNLLNQRLHDQIKANMGTGSARNVLNYRSGRFALSAQVERMSESRAGMITAFLSYMKYPYATFSDGGRQQYPKSRDPKLLLAKLVREIAGSVVSNRMRTVTL